MAQAVVTKRVTSVTLTLDGEEVKALIRVLGGFGYVEQLRLENPEIYNIEDALLEADA